MKNLIVCIAFLLSTLTANSQVNREWVANYVSGPASYNNIYAMHVKPSGDVFVTGYGGSSPDYKTVKYNTSGVEQWAATYNGTASSTDNARDITSDAAGNIYITGESDQTGTEADIVTVKYNAAGVQQWTAVYNGITNTDDFGRGILVDNAGNVYVTGVTGVQESRDIVTIKYNSAGVQQWAIKKNGAYNNGDEAWDVEFDNDGNILVTGMMRTTSLSPDIVLIKYSQAGTELWTSIYNAPGENSFDTGAKIAVDASNNIYVCGTSRAAGVASDWILLKYNSAGAEQWVQRYNGTGNNEDETTDLVIDNSGNIYVTGHSIGATLNYDFVTQKYSPAGNLIWSQRYNGAADKADFPFDLCLDGFGNVYMTGSSVAANTYTDVITIRYNSAGIQQWLAVYDSPDMRRDQPSSIGVDGAGNVYVAGTSADPSLRTKFLVIKYSQSVGVTQTGTTVPEKYLLSQNYPNPFNPTTKINFQVAKESDVTLKVYDSNGKELMILADGNYRAGYYTVDFDGSKLSSGTYFYSITAGDFTETKKMMLVK